MNRMLLLLLTLMVVLSVGCSSSQDVQSLDDESTAKGTDAIVPVPPKSVISSLDCDSLLSNDVMSGACPDVAAAEFQIVQLTDDDDNQNGCFFAKGASDLSASVSIPEAGVAQAVENLKLSTEIFNGKKADEYDIGVKAFYASKPRGTLFFGKGDYFVEIIAGIPEVPLCTPEGLQKVGVELVKNMP